MHVPTDAKLAEETLHVIESLATEYNIDRRDAADHSQLGEGHDYTEDATTARLYCYDPQTTTVTESYGELQRGGLSALCLPDTDIQKHDRLTYGGATYEVADDPDAVPDHDAPVYLQVTLQQVTIQ